MSLSISECEKSTRRLIESTLDDVISFRSAIVLSDLVSEDSAGAGEITVGGSADDFLLELLVFLFFNGDE